jgi:putative DNA primase/helicase
MRALDCIKSIVDTNLILAPLKYCLVDDKKHPFQINGEYAKVNDVNTFVDILTLLNCEHLENYAGVGISIQASGVCAVDLDKCVLKPFDETTINSLALEIINMFKTFAYVEFSFSGKGIRIIFNKYIIKNYAASFLYKNSKLGVEYYQPDNSSRYVTLTGRFIHNTDFIKNEVNCEKIYEFLKKYMLRQKQILPSLKDEQENLKPEELMRLVKYNYFKNGSFQDLWFTKAPGSGKDESERDYRLINYIYNNITKNKEKIKYIFEQSEFFKTKDKKHIYKWQYNDYRYYNYIFNNICTQN